MALADHEKRSLEEIELRLSEDDPKLAARLTRPSRLAVVSGRAGRLLGGLAVYLVGLLAVVLGVSWGVVALVVGGAVMGAGVFVGLIVEAWRGARG